MPWLQTSRAPSPGDIRPVVAPEHAETAPDRFEAWRVGPNARDVVPTPHVDALASSEGTPSDPVPTTGTLAPIVPAPPPVISERDPEPPRPAASIDDPALPTIRPAPEASLPATASLGLPDLQSATPSPPIEVAPRVDAPAPKAFKPTHARPGRASRAAGPSAPAAFAHARPTTQERQPEPPARRPRLATRDAPRSFVREPAPAPRSSFSLPKSLLPIGPN